MDIDKTIENLNRKLKFFEDDTHQEFYETDLSRDFVRGYTFEITRGGGGPVGTALNGVFRGRIPWGAAHHEAKPGMAPESEKAFAELREALTRIDAALGETASAGSAPSAAPG